MPTQNIIPVTPGSGLDLDAVSLTIGLNTVFREVLVIADPSNATYLATVTSGGALNVAEATLDGCITANVLAVSLPAAQITTLTPPTAAAIGTAVSGDLLIGTQLAAASVPVALPTATIITLTPPTAAAIAAAIVANPPTVSVSGTVGVTQSTSPWVISCPTDIEVVQDTAADFNATVVGTGTFVVQASITTLGQQLAAASVPIVLTAAQISTLTPLTTVAVTQSTSPWIVAGGGTAGTAATGVATVQGIAAMTPLLVTATFSAPQHVIVDSGTLTTVSTVTAVTSITNPVAVTGTFFQATQPVSIASGQVASGAFASGSIASGAIASGAIASGAIAAGAAAAGAFADGSVFVRSNAASTFPVTATIAASQTIAVTNVGTFLVQAEIEGHAGVALDAVLGATKPANVLQVGGNDGTNAYAIPLVAGGASVIVSGTVSIGSGPFVVTGNLTNNNAAPSTTNVGALTFLANAAAPSFTEGDLVLASCDLSGHQRVVATGAAAADAAQAGNPILIGGVDGSGNIQELPIADVAAAAPTQTLIIGGTDSGFAYQMSTDGAGNVQVGSPFTQTDAMPNTASAFITKSGNGLVVIPSLFNGITWDRARTATIGNAVAATGIAANASYGEYLSTAPAPTTGQYSALQTDNAGSLFVKNTRRSQTAAQGTTITTSTSATAVTATPAASTFADLSQLVITITPIAVTAIALTATLSDGTNNYIYDLDSGVVATGGGSAISINFNPPLPATSAATGWTVALSVNTVVAHVTTIVVLQKAG